jgi:hypothetical protein
MESFSEIAANRLIIVGKDSNNENVRKAVRCRDVPFFEIYDNFDFKDELHFSTFYNYVGIEFKSPHSSYDLCDW